MFLQLTANEYWDLISAAYDLKGQGASPTRADQFI